MLTAGGALRYCGGIRRKPSPCGRSCVPAQASGAIASLPWERLPAATAAGGFSTTPVGAGCPSHQVCRDGSNPFWKIPCARKSIRRESPVGAAHAPRFVSGAKAKPNRGRPADATRMTNRLASSSVGAARAPRCTRQLTQWRNRSPQLPQRPVHIYPRAQEMQLLCARRFGDRDLLREHQLKPGLCPYLIQRYAGM